MGFFKNILSKLGFGEDDEDKSEKETTKKTSTSRTAARPTRSPRRGDMADKKSAFKYTTKKNEMAMVDVVKKLDGLAAEYPVELNWKKSIVDLLKAVGMEADYDALVGLAKELECPAELMKDSAKMNTWLHKTVLKKIAENGGNIPKDLLD